MTFDLEVRSDWAPAYELVVSLATYLGFSRNSRMLELGSEWADDVRQRGGRALQDAVDAFADSGFEGAILLLLVWLAPEPRTADAFLSWLEAKQPAELYELLLPHLDNAGLSDAMKPREPWLNLMHIWNRVYFSQMDPRILIGLEVCAKATEAKLATAEDKAAVVEEKTNGVVPEPGELPRRIILVPQYHFRPGNMTGPARDLTGLFYPAEALPTQPGQLPPRIRWLTRALSDENRLKILRYLDETPRRFSDIVQHVGLAKSTVYHHLLLLRAAGLVRAHESGCGPDRYSLRLTSIESIGPQLLEFVRGETDQ